jgi:hypothetical protein
MNALTITFLTFQAKEKKEDDLYDILLLVMLLHLMQQTN